MNIFGKSFAVCAISLLFYVSSASAVDISGGSDHPLVTRFAGSKIVGYATQAFDEVSLPSAPFKDDAAGLKRVVKGKVTRIAYESPAGKTPVEIMANYTQALEGAGFRPFFECSPATRDCGGYDFSRDYSGTILDADTEHRGAMLDLLQSTHGDVRYFGATLKRNGGQVDVGLMVSGTNAGVGVLVTIVESGAMATGQVTVDADAMSKGLAADGKIALYGLTFDTDSAKLTAASDPTLKQMSDLLHKQPNLKVYIVGHTDDSGTLAHNLTLSQQRAESVVKALTTTYGIAANRLAAKGLASYAPVASNHSDAGKAKNRRVELVEQ